MAASLARTASRSWLTGAALFGLALAALLGGLADAPPQRAEVYFLDGALRMLETGDFLVPTFRGQPFFDKPPLATWLMAGSLAALDREPWAARLVSVLATLLAALATFTLGRPLVGREAAASGALIFLATPGVLSLGRLAMSDMLLTLFCLLALQAGLAALTPSATNGRFSLAGALLGLAFLTKGPVAILVVGAPLLLAARQEGWRPRASRLSVAVAAFTVCGGAWFAYLAFVLGVEPLRHFFIQENLARAFDPIYDSRRGPLFYPASYLLMGLPWSPLLPLAAWRLRRQRGPQVLLCQVLVVWAALSLSRGKIEYYLLPLYPAVSLLVGRLLTDAEWRQRAAPLMRALAIIWALVAAGVAVLLIQLPSEAPRAPGRLALFAAACLAGAFVLLAIARRPMPGPLLAGGAGMLLSGFAAAQFWFLPLLEAGRPNPAVRAAIRAELARAPDLRLVLCHDPTRVERELLIHERLVAEQRCDLEQAAASAGSLLLLLHDEEIERLAGRTDLEEIGRWGFLPVKTLQQLAQGRPVVARRVALVRKPAAAQP